MTIELIARSWRGGQVKTTKRIISLITAGVFLGSCAAQPDKITASYVSPLQYQGFNCNQLQMELLRVNQKEIEITGFQQKLADKDATAMGVGLVIFWPALFFLIGDNKKEELARLKGEYEVIEQAAIQKECDMAAELKEARKQREAYEAERKKKLEEQREAREIDP